MNLSLKNPTTRVNRVELVDGVYPPTGRIITATALRYPEVINRQIQRYKQDQHPNAKLIIASLEEERKKVLRFAKQGTLELHDALQSTTIRDIHYNAMLFALSLASKDDLNEVTPAKNLSDELIELLTSGDTSDERINSQIYTCDFIITMMLKAVKSNHSPLNVLRGIGRVHQMEQAEEGFTSLRELYQDLDFDPNKMYEYLIGVDSRVGNNEYLTTPPTPVPNLSFLTKSQS